MRAVPISRRSRAAPRFDPHRDASHLGAGGRAGVGLAEAAAQLRRDDPSPAELLERLERTFWAWRGQFDAATDSAGAGPGADFRGVLESWRLRGLLERDPAGGRAGYRLVEGKWD